MPRIPQNLCERAIGMLNAGRTLNAVAIVHITTMYLPKLCPNACMGVGYVHVSYILCFDAMSPHKSC